MTLNDTSALGDNAHAGGPAREPRRAIEWLRVDRLRLDPENPRLPLNLRNADDGIVLDWLLRHANLVELMNSLAETGYFPGEPLLVSIGPDDVFTVVEGNRRFAAILLLRQPERATIKKRAVQAASDRKRDSFDEIPAVIYEHRSEILEYLGYRHITGVQDWNALEKARYLKQLVDAMPDVASAEKYRAAARKIGSRADYVERLLTGLAVHDRIVQHEYWGVEQPGASETNFSVLTTALSYEGIAEWVGLGEGWDPELEGLDEAKLEKLTRWIFEKRGNRTKLGESRNLKLLSQVVVHPKALEAFDVEDRPLQDAVRLAAEPIAVFRAALADAGTRLDEAHKNLREVERAMPFDQQKAAEVSESAAALAAEVNQKLAAGEE